MTRILGISAGFHDAAISVVEDGEILFAGHSERYSRLKHDPHLTPLIMEEALSHGIPDTIAYYEKPWLKKMRQLISRQTSLALSLKDLTVGRYLVTHLPDFRFPSSTKFVHHGHHLSHAAAAFQTSPYDRATVVVIDAIGEWDTISIMGAEYDANGIATYTTLWKQRYPHSIGLFYSAMTQHVGLRPLDEEYILMGMAGYGHPNFYPRMVESFVEDMNELTFKENLHAGILPEFLCSAEELEFQKYHIASSAQVVAENLISRVLRKAVQFNWSDNLVYSGGVALNCLANRMLGSYFPSVWIMPNPGDAGSSLGAAALSYQKKLNWKGPYLGTNISGPYPTADLLKELLLHKIVGVASGRAEFGPRALGNRSLLADPRGKEIKDQVNEIKRRQKFRPFAPVILEEQVSNYFEMPEGMPLSPYMQVTARCKYPDLYPAIVHIDGTSRVQTVPKDCPSGIRQLLELWFQETYCPMLLNTSLNIRGEPMVNTREDAYRFEDIYQIKVCS